MRFARAFFMCLGTFTSLPLPRHPWDEDARGLMTMLLPAVGVLLGLLWYLLALASRAWLPRALAAAAITAAPLLLTGFMHVDGFMDTADAMLSWRPLEQRLSILKDPRCGSMSVAAMGLLLLGMYASAAEFGNDLRALMLVPVTSRCLSAFSVSALKPLGHSEYARVRAAEAAPQAAAVMLAVTVLTGTLWLGAPGFSAAVATAAGYGLSMLWLYRTLKGVSGDLAGFSLSVAELCGMAALAVFGR